MPSLKPSAEFDFGPVLLPGDRVMWPQGTGEPTGLSNVFLRQSPHLPRATVVLGMVTTRTLDVAGEANVDFLCFSGAGNTRRAAALSRNRIVPAQLSAIPGLIRERRIPLEVVMVRARPTADPTVLS